jgi:putative nucleotidyltransferase with HDIG domain
MGQVPLVNLLPPVLPRALDNLLDPEQRPGLEATEHFMSWLRFGISAAGAAASLLALPRGVVPTGPWELLVMVAFVYSIPNIFIRPGRPTRWTRGRILLNTILDFVLVTAALAITGGVSSGFIWLYALAIVGNVLRYGESAGALAAGGSMLSLAGIVLWQGADPNEIVSALMPHLGFFWVVYLMVAYLSRYATRMERVARKGTQLMEAIGRIGVPVNLAGNVALALQAVCEEITILFDVDHVFIWLVQGNEVVGAAATGPAKEEFLTLRRPIDDEHLLGASIVRERRPLYVNNLQGYADGLDSRIARAHGILAVAGIPLIHGDASVGAMILGDSRHANRFRQEDLAPAMLLGNLAATALYHASMHDQLRQAYTRTLETLGEALDARDTYTGGHSLRIARYADMIARQVGCPPEMIDHIRTAAVLHDVGKIGIPDSILLKPGRLNEREMEIMRSHSLIGARLLRTAGFPEDVVTIVRHLHEHYDGWGYPERLRGEAIPLGSRVLAVADAYEAMTSDRIYRPALHQDDALTELARFSNIQFDPGIVDAFIAVYESGASRLPVDEEPGAMPEPAGVFATLTRSLLERFGHFAGDGLVSAVVDRLRAQAEGQGWILRVENGALDVGTPDRQAATDARRQVLAWLLTDLEHAGGQRLAIHLLTETVESLPPAAREVYRGLLDPTPMGEFEEAVSGLVR